LEEPKDPDNDVTFSIYSLLASNEEIEEMRANYLGGNYGYGHAKQALYELIIGKYSQEREIYNHYMSNPGLLNEELSKGEEKARTIAKEVLNKVRTVLGYS